jgi:solute carrier family 36 (proton-coupled amino acid transporter)
MENGLFSSSGKGDPRVKWLKNIFRFFIVMTCTAISWAGAADLDKFVAFVGSFAWYVVFPASIDGP